jgi:hypothetical protein
MVLTLFRYLGMLHRIINPMGGETLKVDDNLLAKLYQAICDKAAEYFSIRDRAF